MTCGACHPEAFRQKRGARVYGYLVSKTMMEATIEARKLYYLGAECVVSDLPQGRVRNREGFTTLCKVIRKGDRLILGSLSSLGTKPSRAEAHLASLEAKGVEVMVARPEFFDA